MESRHHHESWRKQSSGSHGKKIIWIPLCIFWFSWSKVWPNPSISRNWWLRVDCAKLICLSLSHLPSTIVATFLFLSQKLPIKIQPCCVHVRKLFFIFNFDPLIGRFSTGRFSTGRRIIPASSLTYLLSPINVYDKHVQGTSNPPS